MYKFEPRAKLGVIVPSSNRMVENEFHKLLPKGVELHVSRVTFRLGQRHLMWKELPKAAVRLADADVDIIAFVCTGGSFAKGVGWDKELIRMIQEASRKPATTTSTAMVAALNRLGAKKISVASPYTKSLNTLLKTFLEEYGFEVISIPGLDDEGIRTEAWTILDTARDRSQYIMAKKVFRDEADCVFLSCTDWGATWTIDRLEKELKRPVVSSNMATLWVMLREVGVQDAIEGYGTLLRL